MRKLTEAFRTLQAAGLLVEEYPGKGYKKPVQQMMEELKKTGRLKELRSRLVDAVAKDLEKVLPMHMSGIHSDTMDANMINLGSGPSNVKEAKEKAREIFDNARYQTGIPVYLRKWRPVGKNGYGDWLAYFNVFCDDYGHVKEDEIANLLSNNDEYWEILDDLYTHRTNKIVRHEPSEEEKTVSGAEVNNTLSVLNRVSRAPMTKKDWERFESSTIGRQLATLDKLSADKLAPRKHAIMLMMAKKFRGGIGEAIDFGDEEVDMHKVSQFLRWCGIHIPSAYSYRELGHILLNRLKEIKDYFRDELEVLEQ